MTDRLFQPATAGALDLANRVVMAPMTRNRAGADGVPTELNATYYAQRASAGLIVTEGTQPSLEGQGYPGTPGLHTDAQTQGWRRVADAVHAEGGRIVVQLMHAGRISHPSVIGGRTPVAPSAVRPAGQVFTGEGMADFVTPRALETAELPGVVAEYVDAARRAIEAGLDGVELHAANGYLLHQFLADNTNTRTDGYGGSVEGRIRFVVEVATAVAEAIGADRVGIRVSPNHEFNDIHETTADQTYPALVDALRPLGLAYLHVLADLDSPLVDDLRERFGGTYVLNSGFGGTNDGSTASEVVAQGRADLFAIGRQFIANPDLVERIRRGAPVNEPDQSTFYGGDHRGYVDYPTLEEQAA